MLNSFELAYKNNANSYRAQPHRWCNDQRDQLECGRSWVRNYEIGICYISAKHAALRRKSKYWLVQNQANVSECGYVSIRELLFQWASTIESN
jgi:hypothetical protein